MPTTVADVMVATLKASGVRRAQGVRVAGGFDQRLHRRSASLVDDFVISHAASRTPLNRPSASPARPDK